MEEKKQINISFNKATLIIIATLVVIFGTIFYIYHRQVTPKSSITSNTGLTSTTTIYADTQKDIPSNSNTKYEILSSYLPGVGNLDNLFVTSNDELKTYLLKCFNISSSSYSPNAQNQTQTNSLNNIIVNKQPVLTYFDDNFFENYNLAIQMYDDSSSHHEYSIISVIKEGSTAIVNIQDNARTYGGPFAVHTRLNFIILDKNINHVNYDIYRTTTINSYQINFVMFFITAIVIIIIVIAIVSMLTNKLNTEIESKTKTKKLIKKITFIIIIVILFFTLIFFSIASFESLMSPNMTIEKPIIYLYPTVEKEVSVKLKYNDRLTVSYPKYNNGWNVLAKKDGSLIDLSTNKNLYSLYYECNNKTNFKVENDGFIVKGENVSTFLEEKLHILGLTPREAEEFIIYWLPKLEANKYNYIRFATIDEINENMPLEINPDPDTIIRVLMTFKGLDHPIEIQEQKLETPERTGFVAVEWGGSELK